MNTFKYLQSMCGVFGDENEREDPYGKLYRTLVGPALDERAETLKKAKENKLGVAEI